MAETLTKVELLNAMRTEREKLEQAVAPLSAEEITTPMTPGGWSVKDVVAHVTAWEAELVTALMQISQGFKPKILSLPDDDVYNAQIYAEQKDRPLDRILSDFRGVFPQLLKRVSEFSERDLIDARRYSWMKGKPLERLIAGSSYEHYAEHRATIEAWKKGRTG